MTASFSLARLPVLRFGAGVVSELGTLARQWGHRLLLVTGADSFDLLDHRFRLLDGLKKSGLDVVERLTISGEPSPALIDHYVDRLRERKIDLVVAIGGGSVVDGAKSIAGLLPSGDSVMEYLEGVGRGKLHDGITVPLIAVPTTAGTGSEASMNGVLTDREQRFKKSFRHPALVPRLALVDPDLLVTVSSERLAAQGCDALSQLLESYLSPQASTFTDSLAEGAIERLGRNLISLCESEGEDPQARAGVSYGAMISGITLANAGLGAVHGLAGPIGGLFPIPHGVVCGTLLGEANRINIAALLARHPESVALQKYHWIARTLGFATPSMERKESLQCLSEGLLQWVERLQIPRLGAFGVTSEDLERILSISDQKSNPIELNPDEFGAIVALRV